MAGSCSNARDVRRYAVLGLDASINLSPRTGCLFLDFVPSQLGEKGVWHNRSVGIASVSGWCGGAVWTAVSSLAAMLACAGSWVAKAGTMVVETF